MDSLVDVCVEICWLGLSIGDREELAIASNGGADWPFGWSIAVSEMCRNLCASYSASKPSLLRFFVFGAESCLAGEMRDVLTRYVGRYRVGGAWRTLPR